MSINKPLCSRMSSPLKRAGVLQMLGLLTGPSRSSCCGGGGCVCLAQQPHSPTVDFTSHVPPAQGMMTRFPHSSGRSSLAVTLVEKKPQSLLLKILGCLEGAPRPPSAASADFRMAGTGRFHSGWEGQMNRCYIRCKQLIYYCSCWKGPLEIVQSTSP